MRKPSKKLLIKIAREAGCKTYNEMYRLGEQLQDVEYPSGGRNSPLPGVLEPAQLDPNNKDLKAAKKVSDTFFKGQKKL